jgi:phosphate transport system ATP-binding protein
VWSGRPDRAGWASNGAEGAPGSAWAPNGAADWSAASAPAVKATSWAPQPGEGGGGSRWGIDQESTGTGPTFNSEWSGGPAHPASTSGQDRPLAGLDAREISAWFADHQVLDRVSLQMPPGQVTALIGPSGCGKSTFLRILNRMHELIPSAGLAGEVLLDGVDIYDPSRKLTDARRQIGMVFQKPNPFPAMSIYDNVLAGLKLTGTRADRDTRDALVEECLTKGGLWREVRDRLREPGGALSGGQQQRLCIARSLAVRPRVLLMDEPCSALDPTSTRRIEQTILELVSEVTIVIVTHNMQQAARVSNICAFFLAEQGQPGYIVEHGATEAMFSSPQDPRTLDYVNGRFG